MKEHLLEHYQFYGEYIGLRSARKHIGWYCKGLRNSHHFRQQMNTIDSCEEQLQAVENYFDQLGQFSEHIEYLEAA
jgi:tRNA-dihydrouridine synthase B